MSSETTPHTESQTAERTHIGSLPETLQFTDADLAANRAGEISDRQRARLNRAWQRLLIGGIIAVVSIILAASVLIFLGQRNQSPVLSLIGVALTVINAAIVGRLAQNRIRLDRDLRGGVLATHGVIMHTIKVFSRTATYLLEIQGERMLVPKPVFFAFEERQPYTIYRTQASKTLLSAEKSDQ